MNFSKRSLASLMLALPLSLSVQAQEAEPGPLAAGQYKFLGSVYSPSQLDYFTDYFDQVVSENAGKWGVVTNQETQPAAYEDAWFTADGDNSWAGGIDESLEFAEQNGFPYRFHVMLWGNQQPQWMADLDAAAQLAAIDEWFTVVSDRYEDGEGGSRFDFIEVLNEPVNDPPDQPDDNGQGGNYKEALGGDGATGWDWAVEAFELGRTYFPGSTLMVNEYNVLSSDDVLAGYLELIDVLIENDLLDAVGIQAHAFSTQNTSSEDIRDHLNQVAERGLPVYITEMDIDGPDDQVQLEEYRRVFPIFWEHESVQGVTLWGHNPGLWREDAFLLNEDGSERPAMAWLRCYMDSVRTGVPSIFAGQALEAPLDSVPGTAFGQVWDCYGEDSSPVDSWRITGGTGENVFVVSDSGELSLADGQSLMPEENFTLELVAAVGDEESEPQQVNIEVVGEGTHTPAPSALPKGSSGSTGVWWLGLLLLLASARWVSARR